LLPVFLVGWVIMSAKGVSVRAKPVYRKRFAAARQLQRRGDGGEEALKPISAL
jgi:hypothetical protein